MAETTRRCLGGLFVVVALASADAHKRAATQPLDRLDGCLLVGDQSNDGDSFLVRQMDGRTATFRLYFVDAAEERLNGLQSARQARYFRLKPGQLTAIGRQATAFTATALAEPFTIFTRWHSNFDEGRYFAFVQTADNKDLAELLARNGLAILKAGERADSPYGRGSSSQFRRLKELERLAQRDRIGGWAQP